VKIETFRASCPKCGRKFSYPWLGDFSYGSFLFAGQKGGVFGYFNSFKSPMWDFVEKVLVVKGSGRDAENLHGTRIQEACAHFADPIKDQTLCAHDVCPKCRGEQMLNLWPTESTGAIEVPEVTHTNFTSLPEDARRERLLEFDRVFLSRRD
jgi:hypothetical protein